MARSLIVPLLLVAAPAHALTPDELWGAWQDQAAGWGATLAAEAVPGPGGALTLRAWTLALPGLPPEPLPAESPVQEVTLTPTGDGAVAIGLGLPESGSYPVEGGRDGELLIEHDGLAIIARDGADRIDYEVAADALRVVTIPVAGSPEMADFAMEIGGLALRFPGSLGADRAVEVAFSVDGYAYVLNLPDPFGGDGSTQSGRGLASLSLTTAATLPEGLAIEEMEEGADFFRALEQGFAVSIEGSSGAGTQTASFDGFPFSYAYEARSEPATFSMSLDATGARLRSEAGGGSATGSSPDLPFPSLEIAYGPARAEFVVPLGPEPGDFRYLISLEGLTVNEEAWAAIDPTGILPRDPARMVVDLSGRAVLDVPGLLAAERYGLTPPVPPIESLEASFDIAAAGVQAQGSGSFSFDNATGIPMPVGTGTMTLTGANRLIDALVAMGVATDEDARNARLGLAMAFDPGEGEDALTSTIEAQPGGKLYVNGQQMQ